MVEVVRLPEVAMVAVRSRESGKLPRVGKSAIVGGDTIVALGPDEWLVIAGEGDADAAVARGAALCGEDGVAVDVSGHRVRYAVTGRDARGLLARGCSLDLDALAPGDAVSTLVARAQAIVIVTDDGYVVMPRRSFADYIVDWARVAGQAL